MMLLETIHKATRVIVGVSVCLLALTFGVSNAQAEFGIRAFDGQVTAYVAGEPYTQGGGHPFEGWTTIAFNTHPDPGLFDLPVPDADARTLTVELPPGFIGNPTVVPECSRDDFGRGTDTGQVRCSLNSEVGLTKIELTTGTTFHTPLFRLSPSPGSAATFGFDVVGVRVFVEASVRSGPDYGITIELTNISQGLQFNSSGMVLWGTPADPVHDTLRCKAPDNFAFPPSLYRVSAERYPGSERFNRAELAVLDSTDGMHWSGSGSTDRPAGYGLAGARHSGGELHQPSAAGLSLAGGRLGAATGADRL